MVLYYRDLWVFHQLVFDLQLAGATILVLEYTKLLDISQKIECWCLISGRDSFTGSISLYI